MTEDAALEYAIHNQRDRRNLTDADYARVWKLVDDRKKAGRPTELAPRGANLDPGKSSKDTAKILGGSPRKVERTRTVFDHGTEETKEAVLAGEKSINRAYLETQEQRRYMEPERPAPKTNSDGPARVAVFNSQTNDNIEWAKWSWNPVTGCQHGCPYCYARERLETPKPGE